MIFITESIVLCVLFTVLVLSKMNKPLEGMIYSYPPAIVDRVIEFCLIEDTDRKTSSTQKALKRKWPAIIVFEIVLGVFVYFVNGTHSFASSFLIGYGLWLVVDWYDALILDIGWFCHSKKVIIPGTEDMVDAYHDYWFHIKESCLGMLLGLPACMIAGVFCQIIGMI